MGNCAFYAFPFVFASVLLLIVYLFLYLVGPFINDEYAECSNAMITLVNHQVPLVLFLLA
jgi:hypothetical protein